MGEFEPSDYMLMFCPAMARCITHTCRSGDFCPVILTTNDSLHHISDFEMCLENSCSDSLIL